MAAGDYNHFFELCGALREGSITPDQFAELEHTLDVDPVAKKHFVRYMMLCARLRKTISSCPGFLRHPELNPGESTGKEFSASPSLRGDDHHVSCEHDDHEVPFTDQAGSMDIERFARQAYDRFKQEQRRREEELALKAFKTRRRRIVVAVGSTAALITISLFTWLSPVFRQEPSAPVPPSLPTSPPMVATIAQSVDAQWSRPDFTAAVGMRLTTSPLSLQRGLVQIVFDDGAEVILQAPCDLVLKTAGRMVLNRGAVSAVVPPRALGFAIQTPTGIITDHGTEFGVIAQDSGATETHVYNGMVVLASVSGISQGVDPIALLRGQAAAIDDSGQVRRTPFRANTIVREMPEEGGFAVPGERLSLADVVGGGNGFGTGELGYGIDPVWGRFGTGFSYDNKRQGNGKYVLVPSLPLVDGVFVPDGERGPIQVSSLDHRFASCPDTSNVYYYCLVNGGKIPNWDDGSYASLILNGRIYGSLAHPAISIHSNLGVTFDLDAIRDNLPGLRILRFESLCGISAEAPFFPTKLTASFWVLVDGQVRFEKSLQKENGAVSMTVELQETDRFLTLVTTDDGGNIGDDYCLFAEPALVLGSTADGGEGADGIQ